VWDCDQRARLNSLIKRLLCRLLFAHYKNAWLVRIRLCRIVGIRLYRCLVLISQWALSAKLYLLWRIFVIHLLNFLKPAWCSNFGKLSDSLVFSLLETALRECLTFLFFHHSCCSGRWLFLNYGLGQWYSTWAKSPLGAILCVKRAILWFIRFGGRIQFPGGRFLQVEANEHFELVPKIKTMLATLEPIHLMHFQLHVS